MNEGWTGAVIPLPTHYDPSAFSARRPPSIRLCTRGTAAVLLALFSAGCADAGHLFLSSGPTPRVEDCMIVRQATPSQLVCGNGDYLASDGKTYTANQLADIRNGKIAGK